METQSVPPSPSWDTSTLVSTRASSPTPVSSPAPRRDEEFYSQDAVFQVEDVLFKVPRRPFETDSDAFKAMFSLPPPDHPFGIEGSTDERPIHLRGIKAVEFRALLCALFCPSYGAPRTLSIDEWTHVLKLATMWDFESIRDKAIAELGRLIRDPVTRIVLARSFSIPEWVEPALLSLAQQDVLQIHELEQLGWDMAAKLIRVRESVVFTGHCGCGCNYCTVAHGPLSGGAAPNALHLGGLRHAAISAATVRKTYDFTEKIRELFAADYQVMY